MDRLLNAPRKNAMRFSGNKLTCISVDEQGFKTDLIVTLNKTQCLGGVPTTG